MIEAIPQLNPDRPPLKERQHWDAPTRTPALMPAQVRLLALGFASFQMLTVAGVWGLLLQIEPDWPGWYIGLAWLSTAIAAAGVVFFLAQLLNRVPISRNEPRAMIALLVNFLWPVFPTGFIALRIEHNDPFPLDELYTVVAVPIAFVCIVVFHGFPALSIASALRKRIGDDDRLWLPHQSDGPSRKNALIGMSMLVGGWTAAVGVFAYIGPRGVFAYGGVRELIYMLGAMNFAFAGGMMGGLVAALFTATIPKNTRFDRSIPRIFIPVMVIGILCSLWNPMGGALGAIVTGLYMSISVRNGHKLIPLGLCQKCAYNLQGLGEHRCPECGYEHQSHELA